MIAPSVPPLTLMSPVPRTLEQIIPFFTRLASRAQSGYLFHYAFAMVLGIVALVTWMTLFGGAK